MWRERKVCIKLTVNWTINRLKGWTYIFGGKLLWERELYQMIALNKGVTLTVCVFERVWSSILKSPALPQWPALVYSLKIAHHFSIPLHFICAFLCFHLCLHFPPLISIPHYELIPLCSLYAFLHFFFIYSLKFSQWSLQLLLIIHINYHF